MYDKLWKYESKKHMHSVWKCLTDKKRRQRRFRMFQDVLIHCLSVIERQVERI